jgi:hypothetical protein
MQVYAAIFHVGLLRVKVEAGPINHLFSCKKVAIDVAHRPPAVIGLTAFDYTGAMVSAGPAPSTKHLEPGALASRTSNLPVE